MSGAVFEVIRDSSGVKVGEITTDSNGNGSLGGLLKDKYTIKEKKAPEGYMLSTETVNGKVPETESAQISLLRRLLRTARFQERLA